MTFIVYILKNRRTEKHYIGCTSNLERRIEEHNRGQTKSTKRKGEWDLIYIEKLDNLVDARQRESIIKSYKGGNGFKKLVSNAGVV